MVDPQHRAISPLWLGALVFSAAIFIRLAVSLHPYSGLFLVRLHFCLATSLHAHQSNTQYYRTLSFMTSCMKYFSVESREMPWFLQVSAT